MKCNPDSTVFWIERAPKLSNMLWDRNIPEHRRLLDLALDVDRLHRMSVRLSRTPRDQRSQVISPLLELLARLRAANQQNSGSIKQLLVEVEHKLTKMASSEGNFDGETHCSVCGHRLELGGSQLFCSPCLDSILPSILQLEDQFDTAQCASSIKALHDRERAYQSLVGLSVGDSLGNLLTFQEPHQGELPGGPWSYTDDTEMALSVYEMLCTRGQIDQDRLATAFALRYKRYRGYGTAARQLLEAIGSQPTGSWRSLAPALFFGKGSYGNGASMRVAPLGAFFADDYEMAAKQARLSAQVTHSHAEGVAGAVAVALAAAWLARPQPWNRKKFFETVLQWTPVGLTHQGIQRAASLAIDALPEDAAQILGNGHEVASQDTVPFCLWSASVDPDDFHATFWRSIKAGGDQDTICAITCGIVAARTPAPPEWVARREPFP